MEIISLYPQSVDRRTIRRAAELLEQGKLVIYPTDTHPAVAADSLNQHAIAALCRLKGIDPSKQTLTLVCSDIAQAAQYARIDNRAFDVIKRNCPGPFTFILPPAASLPKAFKGRKQVGVRIPDNDIALALADELGHPLVSGSPGETDPMDLDSQIDLMLADASADYALEVMSSTIVDLMDSSSPEIIREGSKELL